MYDDEEINCDLMLELVRMCTNLPTALAIEEHVGRGHTDYPAKLFSLYYVNKLHKLV